MNFDKEKPQNLLLAGSYGTGKSHLARAATIELMQQGYSCMFISVPKLFAKIQESFNKNSSFSESQFISYLQSVDLLVIDDLGTEHYGKDTDGESWGHTKLFEILDGRAGRHTIYTTNLVEEALEDKVNGRNFSRILDNTEIIYMVGPDFRRKRK
nr:ATP-binding protein [Ectobacillus ponti]